MISSLSSQERIAEDRTRCVYATPTGVIFVKQPLHASQHGLLFGITGTVVSIFATSILHRNLHTDSDKAIFYMFALLAVICFLFTLFCLTRLLQRRTHQGILSSDWLMIYSKDSRMVTSQYGTQFENMIGTWDTFPVLFNVRMHRPTRKGILIPYWTTSLAFIDPQTGRNWILFTTFFQPFAQKIRDLLKKEGIPMQVAHDDGTPLSSRPT